MNVISGQNSNVLSPSANLQLSLESKLRQKMGAYGSPEYVLTWKYWDMQSGPQICALRASGHRTSGKGSIGWPTPNAILETRGGLQGNPQKAMERRQQGRALNLDDCAVLAGWHTPQAHDTSPRGKGQKLKHGTKHGCGDLNRDALSACPTPTSRDYKDASFKIGQAPINNLLGRQAALSRVSTEKTVAYRLNPRFSLWLMGFSISWAHCAERVTPSSRRSRRNS